MHRPQTIGEGNEDARMNRRAVAALRTLARRYEQPREIPTLCEVEAVLWRAAALAGCRMGGYWPWRSNPYPDSETNDWTLGNLGWSLPCAEAIGLVRRYFDWSEGRIIDVGAGRGLWTRVLMREFGRERVIGMDPDPRHEVVIKTSFQDWCADTGGPRDADLIVASWLPCGSQPGADLGPQILDQVQSGQSFVYVGSGPNGPTGTIEFYDRLGREFEECATEPLPRIYPSVFPRDFARAYCRKVR